MVRISFDLDDTLISYREGFQCEKNLVPYWFRLFNNEPLRKGTKEIFDLIKKNNFEFWIYTSSMRDIWITARWFSYYQIKLDGMINYQLHQKRLKDNIYRPSKDPRLWNIDLHIDDALGVKLEGERAGFKVLLLTPMDRDWVAKIADYLATQFPYFQR